MATREIVLEDSCYGTSSISLSETLSDNLFLIWRAKDNKGILRENGFLSVDDAERLGYFLFGVVNDYRARQAGDKR